MEFANKRVLVTGGCGFIGSHLAENLLALGAQVRILDNLSTGSLENIAHIRQNNNLEYVWGDIRDLNTVRAAMVDIDMVTHQAALGSVPRSIDNPVCSHESNVTGTLNVFQAAKEAGIKRVVYASSSSVYGDNPNLIKYEHELGKPLSPYAATKQSCELYAKTFWDLYGLQVVGLRYFNVFGPRQNANGAYACAIPKFCLLMSHGERPSIFGDGSVTRDFTFIENVVQANLLFLSTDNENCFGRAYNVGIGETTSINELVAAINSALNTEIVPIYCPPRKGDSQQTKACIDAIVNDVGFEPKVRFCDGIKKTIEWYGMQ